VGFTDSKLKRPSHKFYSNGRMRPSGAKAPDLLGIIGTAKAVPFQDLFMSPLLTRGMNPQNGAPHPIEQKEKGFRVFWTPGCGVVCGGFGRRGRSGVAGADALRA